MMKIPLLSKPFDEHTPESFYEHAKKLSKPAPPKVVKLRKKKKDDNNTGLKPNSETSGKTEADVGLIEA